MWPFIPFTAAQRPYLTIYEITEENVALANKLQTPIRAEGLTAVEQRQNLWLRHQINYQDRRDEIMGAGNPYPPWGDMKHKQEDLQACRNVWLQMNNCMRTFATTCTQLVVRWSLASGNEVCARFQRSQLKPQACWAKDLSLTALTYMQHSLCLCVFTCMILCVRQSKIPIRRCCYTTFEMETGG